MIDLYILKLEHKKYYIGKSNKIFQRIEEHFNGKGSDWTKIFRPIGVKEVVRNCDDYDEDKYVIKYMQKYGIENVRGGSFSRINLSPDELSILNQMIKGANDTCYLCNSKEHFSKDCSLYKLNTDLCYKCNKPGHIAKFCSSEATAIHLATAAIATIATTPIMAASAASASALSIPMLSKDNCYKCNKPGHIAKDCSIPDSCYRCGSLDHKAKFCKV